jgi:hypothetical protein
MKTTQYTLLLLLLSLFAFPKLGFSQSNLTAELEYEVNRVYVPLSISNEKLQDAETINDLNTHCKASWVKEYISVEISTIHKGKTKTVASKNNVLSQKQKDNMMSADVGSDISVNIKYIPDNTLKNKKAKETHFSFIVNPENQAKYSGGQQELKQYLKDNAILKIPAERFKGWDLAVVKFTVTEKGQVIKAHIFETSKDEQTDKLLLETIKNMPNWKPAQYSNGTKVAQEFVLTVGNMENCIVNLLNIRRD